MKLLMPNKTRPETLGELEWVHGLRTAVKDAAKRMNVEIEECEYEVFRKYAFVGDAYRFGILHALFADDFNAISDYLNNCCKVFRGEMPEMEFVNGGLPDFVINGLNGMLASAVVEQVRRNPPTLH